MVDPKKLAEQGWTRQSVASEPRLSEAVETYRSLGLDVLLVPALQEQAAEGGVGACTSCFSADGDPSRYQVIYTRPKTGAKGAVDELFDSQGRAPRRERP